MLLVASASARQSGDADRRAIGGVFVNGVDRGVAVDRRGDIKLIDVIDVDRHHGCVETAVARLVARTVML